MRKIFIKRAVRINEQLIHQTFIVRINAAIPPSHRNFQSL